MFTKHLALVSMKKVHYTFIHTHMYIHVCTHKHPHSLTHTLHVDQLKQTEVVSDLGEILIPSDKSDSLTLSQLGMEERLDYHLRFLKSGGSIHKHLSVTRCLTQRLCFSASSLKLCQESLSTLVSCDFLSTLSDSMIAALTGMMYLCSQNWQVNASTQSACLSFSLSY